MNYIEYINNQLEKKFTLIAVYREDYKTYKKEIISMIKNHKNYILFDEPIDHSAIQIIIAKKIHKKTKIELIEESE